MCCICEVVCKRDSFLLMCELPDGTQDPSYDWQGKLWGKCFVCAGTGMSAKEFAKECKRLHAQRHDIKSRDHKRVRTLHFEDMLAEAR